VKAYLEARPKQERVCLHTCFFGFELGKSTYVDWAVNHKRIYRVYCLEGLQMRHKPPQRRVSAKLREDRTDAVRPNQC
jgi:hypothetical protein